VSDFVARDSGKGPCVPPWLGELRDWWRAFSENELDELADLRLDELLTSDERVNLILSCAKQALARLRSFGEILTKDARSEILRIRPEYGNWGFNIPIDWVTGVGEEFVKLLEEAAGSSGR
jgi:hypothetical protein